MSSLPPQLAQNGHSRGVLPASFFPPAPACTERPQPRRAAGLVSSIHPAPASIERLQPGRPHRQIASPPPGVRTRASAGASCPPSVLPPAPASIEPLQPGRPRCQVASPPPQRAQTGHSRGVLPAKCPPSRPGVRTRASAGACCPLGVLPPAPASTERLQPGCPHRQVAPSPPRRAQTGHSRRQHAPAVAVLRTPGREGRHLAGSMPRLWLSCASRGGRVETWRVARPGYGRSAHARAG